MPETSDGLDQRGVLGGAGAAIESGVLASALGELPAPRTPAPLPVVTLEPLSPGTAAAPRSSARSNARVAVASFVLAVTGLAGALLWTHAPRAPPSIAQTGPRSGSEPALPQLQVGPSPAPGSRQALNVPPAAAMAAPPSEPEAPSRNAPQLLPDSAPIRVLISYAPRSAAARQEAAKLVRRLRGGGLAASGPTPAARVAGKAGITYFFAEDRDGAWRVEHDLGERFGHSRLSPPVPGARLPRPGTIEVLVLAR